MGFHWRWEIGEGLRGSLRWRYGRGDLGFSTSWRDLGVLLELRGCREFRSFIGIVRLERA